jgi:hypothetical protein
MMVGDLLAGRLYGGRGKRHARSVFGPIHGRDNSFHLLAVKAERSPAFNDGIRIFVKGLTDLSRCLHQLPDRR